MTKAQLARREKRLEAMARVYPAIAEGFRKINALLESGEGEKSFQLLTVLRTFPNYAEAIAMDTRLTT